MDLFKWLFGFKHAEDEDTQCSSMKLDRAIEVVTERVSDVNLTFLEDYIGNLLPVYGLNQTVKMTIDYLKANPGYPKVVHRRVHRRKLANAHLEDSGDEGNDEYAIEGGEQGRYSDVDDGERLGGHESDHEGNEDGVSDDEFRPYGEYDDSDEEQGRDGEHVLEVPECGCCFSQIPAGDDVVLCPVKHPFCLQCLVSHASVQLGEQRLILKCMDTSGCDQAFSDRELRHHLPDKLIQLYDNVTQERELREANIPGLVRCPLCPYGCVMEMSTEEEPLFKCHNLEGECGKTTCRMCRKVDHRPFGCDQRIGEDGRLAVEEAMTRALMRNCPRCNNAFIKEDGCNKMTCPSCDTTSCYVCRQVIDDYRHFYDNQQYAPDRRCPLWDTQPLHELHAQEVHAAYEGALAEQALAVLPQPQELARDAWDYRLLVGEGEFEGGLVAHQGIDPEVAAALAVAFGDQEYHNLDGRQLVKVNRREVRNAPTHVDPGFVAARGVIRVIEQPQAPVRPHARPQVQAPNDFEQLQQEMEQAQHAAHLARRRANEAQKRVDEAKGREGLYYRMLNAGDNVYPPHFVCFHYRPGQKCIWKTRDGYNPTPEREAREAHLQFALEDVRQFNQASEEAGRRLREAQAALR